MPEEVSKNNKVTHSLIEDCGQQFYGAIGIWGGLVANSVIDHNEIRTLPYSGISVGWLWSPDPTPCRENTINANHIHHIMNILSDGGGIYSLGLQSGSRITGNLIHDVTVNVGRSESNGMFLDQGSSELLIANNIVYNIARSPLRFNKAYFPNVVRNNVLVCGEDIPPIRYNSTKEEDIEKVDNIILNQSSEPDLEKLAEIIKKRKADIGPGRDFAGEPDQIEKGGLGYLVLNEDNSHFFATRSAHEMTEEGLRELVDHYVSQTQVKQLMFSPNSMCTSYASEVWDPIWHDYIDPDEIKKADTNEWDGGKWQSNTLLLHKRGIDPYAVWIDYSRELGISPWLSMRMNDIHAVDDPDSYMHSNFWKGNPHLRRVPDHFDQYSDRAFDYGQKEVRDYHMALIRELFERYNFDGLELDWMRFGYHFRPGHEEEGIPLLTEFMTEVRRLADHYAEERGHPIRIGARVPSRPWTAKGLGMDAVTWAKKGLVDMLVVTPFWASIETDMPIEKWKEALGDSPVVLAAGLELLVRPYPQATHFHNSAETVLGAAVSLLHRGADLIYLFNYMDSKTKVNSPENFYRILRNAGALETATTHPRRHVVTYSDTWAPGEPEAYALPARCHKDTTALFDIHIGTRPEAGEIRVFIGLSEEGNQDIKPLEVRVNDKICAVSESVPPAPINPVVGTMAGYDIPLSVAKEGYNSVEVTSSSADPGQIVWVEIEVIPGK